MPQHRTPFQGESLFNVYPGLKAWAILFDRSAVIGKCPNSSDRFAVLGRRERLPMGVASNALPGFGSGLNIFSRINIQHCR
jgi:hypothetical protein